MSLTLALHAPFVLFSRNAVSAAVLDTSALCAQEFSARRLAEDAFEHTLPVKARDAAGWNLTFEFTEPFGARGADWDCARCNRTNFGWCAPRLAAPV